MYLPFAFVSTEKCDPNCPGLHHIVCLTRKFTGHCRKERDKSQKGRFGVSGSETHDFSQPFIR